MAAAAAWIEGMKGFPSITNRSGARQGQFPETPFFNLNRRTRHRPLETVRASDEHFEPASKRISHDPYFVRCATCFP
jgi:hypothetical protein